MKHRVHIHLELQSLVTVVVFGRVYQREQTKGLCLSTEGTEGHIAKSPWESLLALRDATSLFPSHRTVGMASLCTTYCAWLAAGFPYLGWDA